MKHLLNVLYVLSENAYLSKQGETICVRVGDEEKVRVPAHTVESIVCFGHTTVSSPLIGFLGERAIGLTFLSDNGRFLGRVEGPVHGNVLLRRVQHTAACQPAHVACLAHSFVLCKIANSRSVLQRGAREHRDPDAIERLRRASMALAEIARGLDPAASVETLRGEEGVAANIYFGVFDDLIRVNKDAFFFRARSRRPPLDNMNATLSFLYVLLANDVRSALESRGLDPASGFLHALRPGRPSLALDLMEELRAPLCDRLALSLVNLRQLQGRDFEQTATGVNLTDKGRRTLIGAWQTRKREEVQHPFFEEKVPVGLLPHLQAQLLARHLRGDLDVYPPYVWK